MTGNRYVELKGFEKAVPWIVVFMDVLFETLKRHALTISYGKRGPSSMPDL